MVLHGEHKGHGVGFHARFVAEIPRDIQESFTMHVTPTALELLKERTQAFMTQSTWRGNYLLFYEVSPIRLSWPRTRANCLPSVQKLINYDKNNLETYDDAATHQMERGSTMQSK